MQIRNLLTVLLGAAALSSPLWAQDDAANKQVIDYYRRKMNLPADAVVSVTNVADAKIPGAKTGTLEITRAGQTQKVNLVMSPDGRYVAFAEVEDITADPFAEIAKKISFDKQPIRGNKKAPITIVEYSDFQCPYCSRAHDTVANQVMKEYGDKVRLVYKNFPLGFHNWAEPAGIATECAFAQNEDAFWKLYDYYFAHQKELTAENIKAKTLEALKDTKVDIKKFEPCYDEKKTLGLVKADMAEGQSVGVSGTPAFLINGRKITGAQPFESFKAVIDDELARKK